MKLPAGFGDLDFADWFLGMWAAFVGGGASAVTAGFSVQALDPKDYNIYNRKIYIVMATVFLVSGLVNLASFLRSKPIPDHKIVTTKVEETTTKPSVTIVKTVEETHSEPRTDDVKR